MADEPDGQTTKHVIREFHVDDVLFAPGNRLVTADSVLDLLPSMESLGQKVPAIVYPHPELPGKFVCAAGNRRLMCCRILGKRFIALVAPGPLSDSELIETRLLENELRQSMSPIELATDLKQYIAITNVTQAEACAKFGFSAAKGSKLLALLELPKPIQVMVDAGALGFDVGRIIASVPAEQQGEFAQRVCRIEENGVEVRPAVKRDSVLRMRDELMAKKPEHTLKMGKYREGQLVITWPGGWDAAKLAEVIGKIAKKARACADAKLPTSEMSNQ